ncbi:hypothetical protein [Nostocoides sp. Soil756]|jgi:hypothetical protein|uniref:hypothetical protein n=1 Tax=Nostocoides sp. Soil756 TaxID=1736399 RepID=UPI0006F4DA05|nr:hypothetical protein [Tetrasphaera sp. Soil756]KRE62380.1 hypothetical protein ASG78_04910 [Tetrasphaera sp. Soil756]
MTSGERGRPGQPGLFTVSIPEWSLAEDGQVLRRGDTYRSWWVFVEADREARPTERLQRITADATLLPPWWGRLGPQSVRLDAGGAVLYWDAPYPVEGPVEVHGWIEASHVDAPPDFPMNDGIVRRVRLEWCEAMATGPRERTVLIDKGRYEEVEASQIQPSETLGDGPVLSAVVVELEIAPTVTVRA